MVLSILVYLALLCFALFIPVHFHLHLHRLDRDDFALLELRFLSVFSWRYQVPFENPVPWQSNGQMEERHGEEGPLLVEDRSDQVRMTGLTDLFDHFNQVYWTLEKYGLGGTLLYLFLPGHYRKYITVAQSMEQKGRFTRFVWFSTLGLPDPALTGVLYGLAWELKGTIMGLLQSGYRLSCQPRIKLTPSFLHSGLDTLIDCIFKIRLGHIIAAGIHGAILHLLGK